MGQQATPIPPMLARTYAWFSALVADDTRLMDDLLLHGLDVDVPHPLRHTTALMEATRLGRTALVTWLLARGAAPAFLCGMPQGTPLHCAIRHHRWTEARALLSGIGNASIADGYGRTPLHLLAMHMPEHGTGVSEALMRKNPALDAPDHEGITALHHAVVNDYGALAGLLLEHGANPNIGTPERQVTPLMIAAIEKNVPLVQLLLAHGADMHATTRDGNSPLSVLPILARMHSEDSAAHYAR